MNPAYAFRCEAFLTCYPHISDIVNLTGLVGLVQQLVMWLVELCNRCNTKV